MPQPANLSLSDDRAIFHVGVPNSVQSPWESASGGVAEDQEDAVLAATGEAVERYAAATVQLPLRRRDEIAVDSRIDAESFKLFTLEQRTQADFPFSGIYDEETPYTNVYDFVYGFEAWVPQPLVVLRDDFYTGIPTSSGLAAASSARTALLRAIQELIERDALMVTWLHSVAGRAVKLPADYRQRVDRLRGTCMVFDLTPAYSPFPVVAVAGGIPKRGKMRYSLGVACRNSWDEALQKAFLEWNQGVFFAGIYDKYVDNSGLQEPEDVKSFDQHAIYYTLHPAQWDGLPLFARKDIYHQPHTRGGFSSTDAALRMARKALKEHGLRLYYRELTSPDALQLGVRVVRALSPDMAAIFAHQDWPLLGGIRGLLKSRYPWARHALAFPNRMPHPLG
jgi:ribosomal protein S12 methylthiotransferase accessory factor